MVNAAYTPGLIALNWHSGNLNTCFRNRPLHEHKSPMNRTNSSSITNRGALELIQRMGEAAENFLASLSTDQRAQTLLDFADEVERTTWYYTPTQRPGLPFTEMDRAQQRAAQQLVMTGLSREGYFVASTIMGLETTLDAKEGFVTDLWWRDSRLYHLSIFGTPNEKKPWGWRFEGHHISLHYTIVGGQIVSPTPCFFGSNPAETPLGGSNTLRPLTGIEDLARELMHTLSDEQMHHVLLTPTAPPDIVQLNRPYVIDNARPWRMDNVEDIAAVTSQFANMERLAADQGVTMADLEAVRYRASAPSGLASGALNDAQRAIMQALIGEYIRKMPDELAEIEMRKLEEMGLDGIHFAWAGGIERRQGHYYRLQGPRFLVEYDNTQNDANHIHSVWRDPQNDFGADLLSQHYAKSHHH